MLISIRDALINVHNLRSDGEKRIRGVINFRARTAEDSCCYTTTGRRKTRENSAPNQRQLLHVTKEDKQEAKPVLF